MRIKIPESHDEWLALRMQGIGGSDAASCVGLGYGSPYTVWLDKTGRAEPIQDNLPMKLGRALEQCVADLFMEETGKKVRKSGYMFRSDEHPFMQANIDRLVVGENAALECKTTSEWNRSEIVFKGEIPAHYYCQCMHYMAVLGLDRMYLAVLVGNKDFKIFTIERDEDEINALIEAEQEVWRMVEADSFTGSMTGNKSETKALNVADTDNETIVSYDQSIEERYFNAEINKKAASQELEAVKNEIKSIMKENRYFRCGELSVTWKTSKDSEVFDEKKFKEEHEELYKSYLTIKKGSRRFTGKRFSGKKEEK